VIASDETLARAKGKTHRQWTFVTATAVAYLIAPTCGKIAPTEFLNGARPKVWISTGRLPTAGRLPKGLEPSQRSLSLDEKIRVGKIKVPVVIGLAKPRLSTG